MKYKKWSIVVLLILLWALGLVASVTFGGFIHVLLYVALVTSLIFILQCRTMDSDGTGGDI